MGTLKSHQQGVTLISLMVGLLISMLAILASLTLYKNLIAIAADSNIDTMHDGQLAASMLTIQMVLQNAGYGIENAATDNVVIREDSSTIDLLWRFKDDSDVIQCRGFTESEETEDGASFRILSLQTVESGCDDTADLTSMAWTSVATVGRWRIREALADYLANVTPTLLDFKITSVECSPYGAVIPAQHLNVTVSAPSSARLHGGTATLNSYDYCLLNT